jgi:hypothetical protein
MGAEILNHAGGVMTLKVSGTLMQPEVAKMQAAAAGIFPARAWLAST